MICTLLTLFTITMANGRALTSNTDDYSVELEEHIIFNQLACIFSLAYFLNQNICY